MDPEMLNNDSDSLQSIAYCIISFPSLPPQLVTVCIAPTQDHVRSACSSPVWTAVNTLLFVFHGRRASSLGHCTCTKAETRTLSWDCVRREEKRSVVLDRVLKWPIAVPPNMWQRRAGVQPHWQAESETSMPRLYCHIALLNCSNA